MTTFERVLVKMLAIFWLCPILSRPNAERRQDPRAVHDLRGPRSEKGPFMARYSRGASPNARLRGFSDAWRAYLAKISCIRIHEGDILPRSGAFPVRGPFGNASGRYLAMARRRMIATEVHRRPILDCNGDKRACPGLLLCS